MPEDIQYKILTRPELTHFAEIDRTETIQQIYYHRDGKLVLEEEHHDVPDWSPENKQERIQDLQAVFDRGATVFGAYAGSKLVGLAVLDHTPVQTGDQRLNLEGLWVSHGYRKRGIGRALFQRAAQEARERGARSMYVSATPSRNTVHFYQNLGCRFAHPVDPTLFEKEPEDIHLEFQLGTQ